MANVVTVLCGLLGTPWYLFILVAWLLGLKIGRSPEALLVFPLYYLGFATGSLFLYAPCYFGFLPVPFTHSLMMIWGVILLIVFIQAYEH